MDSSSGPIPGATVMLIGQEDSILKTFAVTDREGYFTLPNVKPDNYLFKANFYGYEPYVLRFEVGENSTDTALGTLFLEPKMLDVVNVEADYIPIRIKGDTIEYDSRAFEVGAHDVLENLLEQLPGVEVQADGSIKVQGKTVQKILVDGEEFFGNDPTIAVKNLPADAVDKVQVYDKDSEMATFTGVDDGNEETTINLTLKEDRKKGYFGNLEAAYGPGQLVSAESVAAQDRYKLKGNVHYFKNKWQLSGIGLSNNVNETGFSFEDYIAFMGGIQNLMDGSGNVSFSVDDDLPLNMGQNTGFLNTNALGFNANYKPSKKGSLASSVFLNSYDKRYQRLVDRTTFFTDSSLFSQEQVNQRNASLNNRANLHYKQEFGESHFLNLRFAGNWGKSKNGNESSLSNFDRGGLVRNNFMTQLDQNRFQYKGDLSADYRKKFEKKGRYTGLGANATVDNSKANGILNYTNTLYSTSPLVFKTIQNQLNDQSNSKIDANWMFSEPLSQRHLLQVGLAYNQFNSYRNREVYDEIDPENELFNPDFSGKAAYSYHTKQGELKHKFLSKKLKTTAGVAYQNLTLVSSDLFVSSRAYHYALTFFTLQWEPSKSSELRLDYSTRANAPHLVQLQTVPNNSNPAEVVLGNPNLDPEYIQDLGVEYNLFNEFNFTHFMIRLDANHIANKINFAQEIDSNFNRIYTPKNSGFENQLRSYLSFGTNLSPLKTKFTITNNFSLSNGQIFLNSVQNNYTSVLENARLSIENTKKKIFNIRLGIEGTYSKNVYRENEALNSDFFSWNYSGNLTVKLKDNWIFNGNLTHHFYPSFTANNEQMILNASVARNFLKSKKLQVYLAAFDLFNQNSGINQSYYLNYYEQERTATLARYAMLGIKYSFQKLGGE